MAENLFDAVYGSLIGGAIGDALGAPVEGWYWHEIREKYSETGGHITEFEPGKRGNTGLSYGDRSLITPPGQFTDDTTLRHYQCLAIVRKGGRITPDDFAAILLEKLGSGELLTDALMIVVMNE